jgi:signal transduction histidine kinase
MANDFLTDPPTVEPITLTEQRLVSLLEEAGRIAAKLGHDLRSPLHLVSGYADLLSAESFGPLTVKQREFVESIRHGAKMVELEIDRSQERLAALLKTGEKS